MELRHSPAVLFSSLLVAMLVLTDAVQPESYLAGRIKTRGRHALTSRTDWESTGEWALRDFRFAAPLSGGSFLPTSSRCCKVGDTTARRRQGCTLAAQASAMARTRQNAELRQLYGQSVPMSTRVRERALADKVADCYNSPFSKNFKKCCFHRTLYIKEMNQCRRLKKGRQRKVCRREVRKKYP